MYNLDGPLWLFLWLTAEERGANAGEEVIRAAHNSNRHHAFRTRLGRWRWFASEAEFSIPIFEVVFEAFAP